MDWFLYDRDLSHERVNERDIKSVQFGLDQLCYVLRENIKLQASNTPPWVFFKLYK